VGTGTIRKLPGRCKEAILVADSTTPYGTERNELLPDIRSLPIENHTLFYRVTENTVEIIRVLHGRQDAQRHLNSTTTS